MKTRKINYSFKIDEIIQANLGVQSIQKSLKDNFGIFKADISIFKNDNFIKNYSSWSEDKKHKFIKTIGGVVYYGKVKSYLNQIVKNGDYNYEKNV